MPVIRKKLSPDEVYPSTIRYNPDTDQVQSLIDGEWVDNPAVDPRLNTTFPPRVTSDTTCDAAQSVSDAFQNQIAGIITAIDGAATAFTIAGFILGLLSFGVFAIFISIALAIADAMIGAGAASLTAALTPTVWHQFTCILYCQMDTNGRLKTGGFVEIQSDVASQIGGLAGTVINSFIALAGEGGINNLASLGTSTGDCDDCGCPNGCPEKYRIYDDNPANGSIVEVGADYLIVECPPSGIATLQAIDLSDCCIPSSYTVLSGVATPSAWRACGNTTPPPWIATTPIGNCCNVIEIQWSSGVSGGQIKIFFSTCP